MRVLLAAFMLLVAGCAGLRVPTVDADYVTGLQEPIVMDAYLLPIHSTFAGLRLVDSAKREVVVYRDFAPGSSGELLLADFRYGRTVDYRGEEGDKLLRILEALDADEEMLRIISDFASAIRSRRNRPNQALQPTRMLVTCRADARPAPSTRVADL